MSTLPSLTVLSLLNVNSFEGDCTLQWLHAIADCTLPTWNTYTPHPPHKMTFCTLMSKKKWCWISCLILFPINLSQWKWKVSTYITQRNVLKLCASYYCKYSRPSRYSMHPKLCTSYILAVFNSKSGDQEIKLCSNDQRMIGAAEKLTEIEWCDLNNWLDLHESCHCLLHAPWLLIKS